MALIIIFMALIILIMALIILIMALIIIIMALIMSIMALTIIIVASAFGSVRRAGAEHKGVRLVECTDRCRQICPWWEQQ